MRCIGTTAKQKQCKLQATLGFYCQYHVSQASTKPGYVYAYVLTNGGGTVFNKEKQRFDKLKPSLIKRLVTFGLAKPRFVLVKVGYTTSTPKKRLQQWKKQCRHEIILLGPKQGFGFDMRSGGWPARKAARAEKDAHAALAKRFGRGEFTCSHCAMKHVEWFLVPRKEINDLFEVVARSVDV